MGWPWGGVVFLYLTLQGFKESLGIPAEDASQDALLLSLLGQAQQTMEAWMGQKLWHRRMRESISVLPEHLHCPTIVEVLSAAYVRALQYVQACRVPHCGSEREHQQFCTWFDEAVSMLEATPELDAVVRTHQWGVMTCGHVSCRPRVHLICERQPPYKPVVRTPNKALAVDMSVSTPAGVVSLRRELRLVFTWGVPSDELVPFEQPGPPPDGSASRHRLDVILYGQGEKVRSQFPPRRARKLKQLFTGLTHKRLYLPFTSGQKLSQPVIEKWTESALALLCLYLVQPETGLLSLDDDLSVRDVLLQYISRVAQHEEVEATEVLEIMLRSYRIPEDPWAFHSYIRKTFQGLWKNQKRQYRTAVSAVSEYGASGVEDAADLLGISVRTLYDHVAQGKIDAHRDQRGLLVISAAEVERLRVQQSLVEQRKALITLYAKARGITEKSAWRWMKRQEVSGVEQKDIYSKIRDAIGNSLQYRQVNES
jgi:excisionase family DNA binding protein